MSRHTVHEQPSTTDALIGGGIDLLPYIQVGRTTIETMGVFRRAVPNLPKSAADLSVFPQPCISDEPARDATA